MRIHISTIAPAPASREIMQHMQTHGGEWIVNTVEDEGYVMARMGTLDGKRLERSFSLCLCGPFNTAWSVRQMAADMKAAREIGSSLKVSRSGSSKGRGRPKLSGPPQGEEVMVMDVLRRHGKPLAVTPIADLLGIKRKKAADLLRKLREREHVIVAGRESDAGYVRFLYAVAA